ncbi:hypothetical protein [Pedococcus sp. 5OH_020]|uniref:hypothetical protein n=1 Tax=Pedococcus sp. 5OH_020 TaxID=2989814 RepID=UPI0022E9F93F|nr:hypothetical protein [Pedococcus sp. 5OH_020]
MEYPKLPEARAQSIVRSLKLSKAARTGQRIWVGRDSLGVAAVASWKWIERDLAIVCVVALSRRLRGHGLTYTREMVDTATAQISGDAADRGLREFQLIAYIHKDNRPSRAFANRFEMDQLTDPDKDGYALHSVTLPAGETDRMPSPSG